MTEEEMRKMSRRIPWKYQERARFKLYGVVPPFPDPFFSSYATPKDKEEYLEKQEKILNLAEKLVREDRKRRARSKRKNDYPRVSRETTVELLRSLDSKALVQLVILAKQVLKERGAEE